MSDAVELSTGRRVRRWRSISEKLEIVQLTLQPGAESSVPGRLKSRCDDHHDSSALMRVLFELELQLRGKLQT